MMRTPSQSDRPPPSPQGPDTQPCLVMTQEGGVVEEIENLRTHTGLLGVRDVLTRGSQVK